MFIQKFFKETVIYGGADLLGKVISFFTFPIIAAALGPEDFGYLDLILTIVALLGIVISCGLNGAAHRFYWDDKTKAKDKPLIVSGGLIFISLFSVILMALSLLVVPAIMKHAAELSLPFSAYALFAAVSLVITSQITRYVLDIIRLHFAPLKFFTIAMLARAVAALLGVYAVVYLSMGIDGLLMAQAFTGVAIIPLAIYFIKKDVTAKVSRPWLAEMLKYGYPLIFANIAFWLFTAMDRWMLIYYSSATETGIYSLAFRLSTIVLFVSVAISSAWRPYAIKIKADNPEHYREIYSIILLFFLYLMLCVGGFVALFSGEVISILLPETYNDSALPLSILCFAIILQATQQITIIGISLEKKTYLLARIAWATAFFNLILNLILIPEFGAMGAAFATLVSYLLLTAIYLYFTQRLHFLPICWKKLSTMLAMLCVLLVTSIVGNQVGVELSLILTKLMVFIIILAVGFFLLPINRLKQIAT